MNFGGQFSEPIHDATSRRRCDELSLVLTAVGIDHAVRREVDRFVIVVAPEDADRARNELAGYESDQTEKRGASWNPPEHRFAWHGVGGYACILVLMFVLKENHILDLDWLEAGKAQATLIRAGARWRALTALTLHADLVHLAGNLLVGGLVGLYAGRLLGVGFGWFSIVLAGGVGNLLNAYVRASEHTSIGASTAVFAALGLIAAYGQVRSARRRLSFLARMAPLIGATVLLSWLGTSGGKTDVGAHVLGFASGVALGACLGRLGSRVEFNAKAQIFFGIVTLAALVGAWIIALSAVD